MNQKLGLQLAIVMVFGLALGCEPPPKASPTGATPPAVPPGGAVSVTPAVPATTTSPAAGTPGQPAGGGQITPELIQKVNDLVRLTKEYNAIAANVKSLDDYRQNQDALAAIEEKLEPYVIDLQIEQDKLSPAARAEWDSKYFEGLAKPVVEEKRAHLARFRTFVQ